MLNTASLLAAYDRNLAQSVKAKGKKAKWRKTEGQIARKSGMRKHTASLRAVRYED